VAMAQQPEKRAAGKGTGFARGGAKTERKVMLETLTIVAERLLEATIETDPVASSEPPPRDTDRCETDVDWEPEGVSGVRAVYDDGESVPPIAIGDHRDCIRPPR
jgi:hypothetical protein